MSPDELEHVLGMPLAAGTSNKATPVLASAPSLRGSKGAKAGAGATAPLPPPIDTVPAMAPVSTRPAGPLVVTGTVLPPPPPPSTSIAIPLSKKSGVSLGLDIRVTPRTGGRSPWASTVTVTTLYS